MNYLDRNAAIFEELRGVRLHRGQVVGESFGLENTTFTTLGSYESTVLGTTTYVGLKESRKWRSIENRVAMDMALIHTIQENYPHLTGELPAFYGLVSDHRGQPIGILAEDFSQGGQYKVESVRNSDLFPREVEALVGDQSGDRYEEAVKMCFVVNGKRRLGDFDTIIHNIGADKRQELFPYIRVLEELERYTFQLDYDL